MPEQEIVGPARRARHEGKAASTQPGEFVREEIDNLRRCDFDGSGNGLALGGNCLLLQCEPLNASEICEIPGGKTGRRSCEEFQTWGARWSKCQ